MSIKIKSSYYFVKGVGRFEGFLNARFLKKEVDSFLGAEIMGAKNTSKIIKELSRIEIELKNIDKKLIPQITKRFSNNETKLEDERDELIHLTAKEITDAVDLGHEFLRICEKAHFDASALEISSLAALEDSLEIVRAYIEKGQIHRLFVEDQIKKAEKELDKAIDNLKNKMKNDLLKEKNIFLKAGSKSYKSLKKHSPAFLRLKMIRLVEYKEKKKINRIIELKAKIDEQLSTRNVQINFLPLVTEYAQTLKKLDDATEKLKKDFILLISEFEYLIMSIFKSATNIAYTIGKDNSDKIEGLLDDLKTEFQNLKDYMRNDAYGEGETVQALDTLKVSINLLLEAMKNSNKIVRSEIDERIKSAA